MSALPTYTPPPFLLCSAEAICNVSRMQQARWFPRKLDIYTVRDECCGAASEICRRISWQQRQTVGSNLSWTLWQGRVAPHEWTSYSSLELQASLPRLLTQPSLPLPLPISSDSLKIFITCSLFGSHAIANPCLCVPISAHTHKPVIQTPNALYFVVKDKQCIAISSS